MPHPFRLYKENKIMVSNRPVYYQTKHNRKKNCLYRFCTAAMLHDRNNRFHSYGTKMIFLMQNIFIVSTMQHGCRAKPL